jgi:hypothetical protein
MDFNHDELIYDHKKRICNGILENFRNTVLSCTKNKVSGIYTNLLIESVDIYECSELIDYKRHISNYNIKTYFFVNHIHSGRPYTIDYDPKQKLIIVNQKKI